MRRDPFFATAREVIISFVRVVVDIFLQWNNKRAQRISPASSKPTASSPVSPQPGPHTYTSRETSRRTFGVPGSDCTPLPWTRRKQCERVSETSFSARACAVRMPRAVGERVTWGGSSETPESHQWESIEMLSMFTKGRFRNHFYIYLGKSSRPGFLKNFVARSLSWLVPLSHFLQFK